ncbi:MAG TPA: hypothetical protein VK306_06085 [Acidimicrobiales bacterium]|nr:hypothetical protein [Acidimicrobiales bacterium]
MATHQSDLGTEREAERYGRTAARTRRTFTESKAGYKTTEFILTVVAIVAILIATYVEDANLDAADGWRYATWVAIAYIVSRGLAKLGTREPYSDEDYS